MDIGMQVCVPVVQRMMARTPATVQAIRVFMMTVPMCCRDSWVEKASGC